MKTLYLECGMGAAGDMLAAALFELMPDREAFLENLNRVGIPGVHFSTEASEKCGVLGTHMTVKVHGQEEGDSSCGDNHVHGQVHIQEWNKLSEDEHIVEKHPKHNHAKFSSCSGMSDITKLVESFQFSETVKQDILAVYRLLADAESHVHGVPVEEIHFHEVGNLDAVADITAVCLLMDCLKPEKVIVSPIHVGCGQVRCAHGTLPVPAPATAHLLQGVPVYGGAIQGELCTPTGAALLKYFATSFGSMPIMTVSGIGYGMGNKDFEVANCVRAFWGETVDVATGEVTNKVTDEITGGKKILASGKEDEICELSCNVDDMTGEEIGFAMEQLLENGALDVWTIPIGMKKSRPGILIQVLCREMEKEKIRELMFRYTTTLGIREDICRRYVLEREIVTLDTSYGPVRRKDSFGYGVRRSKYEYEDVARMAREEGCSISEMIRRIERSDSYASI